MLQQSNLTFSYVVYLCLDPSLPVPDSALPIRNNVMKHMYQLQTNRPTAVALIKLIPYQHYLSLLHFSAHAKHLVSTQVLQLSFFFAII
jgi:hypothetical protein